MNLLRPTLLGLALLAAWRALPAADEVPPAPPPVPGASSARPDNTGGWSIHGGPVERIRGEPARVSGTFEVRTEGEGPAAEGKARQGGACLVADLVPFGIGRAHCATNADCNGPDAIDKLGHPGLAEYHGYCAARDGSAEAPRCWTRPGPASTHCRRTVDGLRLNPGVHALLGPVDADPLSRGEPRPRWAVYACLAHEGHDRACAEPASPHRQVSLTPLKNDADESH
jgi:hypothetical protein